MTRQVPPGPKLGLYLIFEMFIKLFDNRSNHLIHGHPDVGFMASAQRPRSVNVVRNPVPVGVQLFGKGIGPRYKCAGQAQENFGPEFQIKVNHIVRHPSFEIEKKGPRYCFSAEISRKKKKRWNSGLFVRAGKGKGKIAEQQNHGFRRESSPRGQVIHNRRFVTTSITSGVS